MAHPIRIFILIASQLIICNQSYAIDTSGYFRAGVGTGEAAIEQPCFKLAGAEAKYRLGNECDVYGEVLFSQDLVNRGYRLRGHVMAALSWPGGLDDIGAGDQAARLAQSYFSLENLDLLHGGQFWLGNRFYKREDVHSNDFFYWNPSGIGLGIEDYGLPLGRLSYAVLRKDSIDQAAMAPRHDLQWRGLPVNAGGELAIGMSYIQGLDGRDDGWAAIVQHKQADPWGGMNTLALQYGTGPATGLGATGALAKSSDDTRFRVVDHYHFKVARGLDGQATAIYQRDMTAAGDQTWLSVGGRLAYSLAPGWKLLAEYGHDQVKPESGPIRRLDKLTLAPAWSPAEGVFGRPEIRLFVTYARWNEAARAAAAPGDSLAADGVFGGDRHGLSAGVQAEHWW